MEVLITELQIKARVKELACKLAEDYAGRKLHVVFVLKGAFVFCADLLRELSRQGMKDITVDYITTKSYEGKESTGRVRIEGNVMVKDKDVLVVEDIVDTGISLSKLMKHLAEQKPNSLKLCCLLDKPSRRKLKLEADYVGFVVPDRFIVGYGLDCDEQYRELPYIAAID